MMPKPARTRSVAVDAWKTLAIFGVVLIHCGHLVPHSPARLDWLAPTFQFCVPVFLLFWAYFAEQAASRPGWSYRSSLGRAGSLVVAFLLWSTAYWLLKGDFESSFVSQITRHWSGYGWSGQYFFVVLLQLILLFPLLRRLASVVPAWIAMAGSLAVIALGNVFADVPWWAAKIGDRPFVFWIPYVLAGIHLARGGFGRIAMPWWVPLVLCLPIPFERNLAGGALRAIGPYLSCSVAVATYAIGIAATRGGIPDLLGNDAARGALRWISTRTLSIFCINPLFVVLAPRWTGGLEPLAFRGAGFAVPLATAAAVVLACLALERVLTAVGLGFSVRN